MKPYLNVAHVKLRTCMRYPQEQRVIRFIVRWLHSLPLLHVIWPIYHPPTMHHLTFNAKLISASVNFESTRSVRSRNASNQLGFTVRTSDEFIRRTTYLIPTAESSEVAVSMPRGRLGVACSSPTGTYVGTRTSGCTS